MSNYHRCVVVDFEYEVDNGDLPRPLCMVAYVLDERLRHVRTIRLWCGEFGPKPPFDIGPDTLVVAYAAWAELTCFQALKWQTPAHVLDLHAAYLATSNILMPYEPDLIRSKARKGLSAACRAYDIDGWENIDKPTMAEDIGEGRWRKYGKGRVFKYCQADVEATAKLLRRMVRGHAGRLPIDVERALFWSRYSGMAVAQIQAKGMFIDTFLWGLVQEHKGAVVEHLLRRFDPGYGTEFSVFEPDGSWSYARFEQWLANTGVQAWPRLRSGRLDLRKDTFKLMAHVPDIAGVRALREGLRVITSAKLPIGRDSRNRPSLFPFGTLTGRNAHARSLFNAHAGLRSFMVCPPGRILVYLDWRAQEPGLGAALSGDQALMAAYASGDIYHAFARSAGLASEADPQRWKDANPEMRQNMKRLQLAISYGMGVTSLARGLDRHPLVASDLLQRHERAYPRFWAWRRQQADNALLTRKIETVYGWPLHLSTSPNLRTLYNFPLQGNGAEMLRLAAVRLCESGHVPSMLVHDGILVELECKAQIAEVADVMRWAGREVCGGFEIAVDIDQKLTAGQRFQDKRPVAKAMWETIMAALETVGALPRRLRA